MYVLTGLKAIPNLSLYMAVSPSHLSLEVCVVKLNISIFLYVSKSEYVNAFPVTLVARSAVMV